METELNEKKLIYYEYQTLLDLHTKNQQHINKLQFEVKRVQKMNDRYEQIESENLMLKTQISNNSSDKKKSKIFSSVDFGNELQKLSDELAAVQQF